MSKTAKHPIRMHLACKCVIFLFYFLLSLSPNNSYFCQCSSELFWNPCMDLHVELRPFWSAFNQDQKCRLFLKFPIITVMKPCSPILCLFRTCIYLRTFHCISYIGWRTIHLPLGSRLKCLLRQPVYNSDVRLCLSKCLRRIYNIIIVKYGHF